MDDLDQCLADLPEGCRRWVEFQLDGTVLSMGPDVFDSGWLIRMRGAAMDEDLEANYCLCESLFYPIVADKGYALGRMEYFLAPLVSIVSQSVEDQVLEERWLLAGEGRDCHFFFSALLADGRVLLQMRRIWAIFESFNSPIWVFPRKRPENREVLVVIDEQMYCWDCGCEPALCFCSQNEPLDLAFDRRCGSGRVSAALDKWYALRGSLVDMGSFNGQVKAIKISKGNIDSFLGSEIQPLTVKGHVEIQNFSCRDEFEALQYQHVQKLLRRLATPLVLTSMNKNNYRGAGRAVLPFLCDQDDCFLEYTIETEIYENNISCSICGMTFGRKYELQRHHRIVHENHRSFSCELCGKNFALKQYLTNHMQAVHEKRRDKPCSICGLVFSTQSKVNRHLRSVHLKEKKFSCPTCDNSFFQLSDLQRHCKRLGHV